MSTKTAVSDNTRNEIESGSISRRPPSKKQRLILDDDGEEDKKARTLLKEIGFDPENVNERCHKNNLHLGVGNVWGVRGSNYSITPMIYFCRLGNLDMCRYLFSRGADCTQSSSNNFWFPMYAAALGGSLDLCQWLFHHGGAKDDIGKKNSCNYTPLKVAINHNGKCGLEVSKWLILNGVLCIPFNPDASIGSVITDDAVKNNLTPECGWTINRRPELLLWAREVVTTHQHFMLFLKGTVTSSSSLLETFNGKSGILELIGEYVGNPKAKDVRTLRQLIELLSAFIEEWPLLPIQSDEEEVEVVEEEEEEEEEEGVDD